MQRPKEQQQRLSSWAINYIRSKPPFCVVDGSKEFTKSIVFLDFPPGGSIDDLVDGSRVSNCPLPCKTTQTHTEFLNDVKGDDETFLDISFSSRVRVTKTDLVKPTLSSFLSEVGLKACLCIILYINEIES